MCVRNRPIVWRDPWGINGEDVLNRTLDIGLVFDSSGPGGYYGGVIGGVVGGTLGSTLGPGGITAGAIGGGILGGTLGGLIDHYFFHVQGNLIVVRHYPPPPPASTLREEMLKLQPVRYPRWAQRFQFPETAAMLTGFETIV